MQSKAGAAPEELAQRIFAAKGGARPRWRPALAGWALRSEPLQKTDELVLDGFDRRLQKVGLRLVAGGAEPHVHCRLWELEPAGNPTGDPREAELEGLPAFAWDFPPPLAHSLIGALEARRLEPIARHEARLARWAVLDEHGKTVTWIEEELHRVLPVRSRRSARVHRLRLRAVRGYESEFARIVRELEQVQTLDRSTEEVFDPLEHCRSPRRPAYWPGLRPDVRALDGLARIARAQLAILKSNESGVRQNRDAEYLHDTRVALRRLRSLLSQLAGVLDETLCEHLVTELRWLAACTGPARDLDTLMQELRLLAPDLRAELAPVLAALEVERKRQHALLVAELDSERRRALVESLHAALDDSSAVRRTGKHAAKRFATVLAKRLRRRLGRVLGQATVLDSASSAEDLHELRIAAKKLRYLLECCRGLAPKEMLSGCFAHLKAFQDVLGTIQDAEIHARLVAELALPSCSASALRAPLALGRFLERSARRSQAARARYPALAAELASPAGRGRFAELFDELEAGPRR